MAITEHGVEINIGGSIIRAWSCGGRLPFETRSGSEARLFRDGIRAALPQLVAAEGQILKATLTSPQGRGEVVDTENVLLYNVGRWPAFAPSCRRGISFERVFRRPDQTQHPGAEHLSVYRLVDAGSSFEHWVIDRRMARLDWTAVPPWTDSSPDLSVLWWTLRQAQTFTVDRSEHTPQHFAIRLELAATVPNTAPLVKRIVDGLVLSLEAQDRPVPEPARAVIAAQVGEREDTIEGVLRRHERAVLGRVPSLVHARGYGVQWAPADHGLVAFELALAEPVGAGWGLRGEVEAVRPRL